MRYGIIMLVDVELAQSMCFQIFDNNAELLWVTSKNSLELNPLFGDQNGGMETVLSFHPFVQSTGKPMSSRRRLLIFCILVGFDSFW